MSHTSKARDIKIAQKESSLMRKISHMFMEVSMDEPSLRDLFINRVHLSPDKGHCTIYFYTAAGKTSFKEKLPILILYKPSMRHTLSQELSARYTPDLRFEFDEFFEKQQRVESLLESIKEETQETEKQETEKR